jgi:hypothetical protein
MQCSGGQWDGDKIKYADICCHHDQGKK